ncbi:hypothetical protein BFP76_08235 [Amylibacter kogurei]|uniref:EamA domain-containing protein n=1 Tax=Paramylibacter kogurei TaxID=1889778 RepID=A0A2G5K1V8_9RHOB|nr:DMT family transporter [Amylibacter kogurei]PIB23518.1 hypothetical protein BFP76_08235 [Amylibacter kogurei]
MTKQKSNGKAAMLALCAFAIFATHDVVVKVLGAHYAPFQVSFFNVLFGFPLVTLMLMRDANPGTLLPVHPWWTALRTIAAVMGGVGAFFAFALLPLAQAYAILFSMPLIITVLSIPVLGEAVGIRRWMAVLVGLCGVLIVLRPGDVSLELGHLAALVAAVGGATASIIVRKIGQEERVVVLLLYPMIATFVLMAILMPFYYKPMPIEHLGLQFLVALLGTIATMFMIAAYRTGEAVIVAPMQYSQIIWATIFGYVLFNEVLDMPTIIGAAVIIASGLYIVLRESRSGSKNTPVLRTRSRFEMGANLRVSQILRRDKNKATEEKNAP